MDVRLQLLTAEERLQKELQSTSQTQSPPQQITVLTVMYQTLCRHLQNSRPVAGGTES